MKKRFGMKSIASTLLAAVMVFGMVGCSSGTSTTSGTTTSNQPTQSNASVPSTEPSPTQNNKPITIVWYPNESASDYAPARDNFANYITQATGRKVEHKLTTDYAIAIEALASGSADISFMGAAGYIEAKNKNPQVAPLIVNSGASGTLEDAIYYSWLAVNKGQEDQYKDGDKYAIANIQGKKISFVSNSSTSGFKVPTKDIVSFFQKQEQWKNLTVDDLTEGGSNAFFSEVMFGGSHQGSAFNLVSGKSEVAAFCDTELAPYDELKEGDGVKPGTVYAIKTGASAPFDTVTGKEFVVIHSTPVLNGPFAYNPTNFTPDEIKAIQDTFLSDAVANDPQMFVKKDSGMVGMFKKTDKECFVTVEDAWYNPIREMN